MNWRPIPFVRLLIPLVAGIVLQEFIQITPGISFLGLELTMTLLAILILAEVRFKRKNRWIFGAASNFFLISLGICLHYFHQENNQPAHFGEYVGQQCQFAGTVKNIIPKGKNYQVILQISSLGADSLWPVKGQLLAYLPIDSTHQKPSIGDTLMCKAYISPPSEALNPKAFDYARFLHTRNIHFTAYIKTENWHKINHSTPFSLIRLSQNIQNRCLKILQKHLPTERERAVASALILGFKPDLSQETKTAYSNTGAMHVLAVSGLHTGFIYLIVWILLNKVPLRNSTWLILKTTILIGSLWLFALITGAAPSVLRSATMFSFVAFGKALNRQANIYNTLAASAFCLLLVNPFLIFAPGFQLSYLAVSGIVYFQPLIYRLLYFKNKLTDYLWNLTAVSCSAQLSTFPLSLYYFHKLPLYFWLSGMIVIPAAALILPLGLLLFVVDKIPLLGSIIGKILHYAVSLMNFLIFSLQDLPGAILTKTWIGPTGLVLIFGSIGCLVYIIEQRKARGFITMAVFLLLLSLGNIYHNWKKLHQKNITIYRHKKVSSIDLLDGNEAYTISSKIPGSPEIKYTTEPHLQYRAVTTRHFLQPDSLIVDSEHLRVKNNYFQFYDKHLFVLNNRSALPPNKLQVDFLLFTGNPEFDLKKIDQHFEFSTLIIDATNRFYLKDKWIKYCQENDLDYWDMSQKGAFTFDF
ncbi:MAG: ComEC family competence protein [Bacteroidetes bacterium]|nr:MAG: ComEC family competence protein [Bacteroidota bacterium]